MIEVSADSVEKDRTIKLALYAQAGVVEYWIVNLPARRIEIYATLTPMRSATRSRSLPLPGSESSPSRWPASGSRLRTFWAEPDDPTTFGRG